MKALWNDLKKTLSQNFRPLLIGSAILVLAYALFLISPNERMDSILKLKDSSEEFNDLALGRFGIVLLNRVLGMRAFNPYLTAFLTLLSLALSGCLLYCLLDKVLMGKGRHITWLIPFLFFLSPCWVEQFYFSYQSFVIMLGILLLECSLVFLDPGTGWPGIILAALMTALAFSVYQAFVPLMLCLIVGLILLKYMTDPGEASPWLLRYIGRGVLVFLGGLVLYFIVNKFASAGVQSTDYLSGQVLWGTMPVVGVFRNLWQAITSILLCKGTLDMPTYPVSLLLSALALLVKSLQTRKAVRVTLLWTGWFYLQLAAFSMVIVLGSRSATRTEQSFQLTAAFNFLLSFLVFLPEKLPTPKAAMFKTCGRTFVCLTSVVCLCFGSGMSFRLMYSDDVRYQYDISLAGQLIADLKRDTSVDEGKKPVIFVGETETTFSDAFIEGEAIGRSLFAFHRTVEATNTVIHSFLSLHGLNYPDMSNEQMMTAHVLAENMPCYPKEGSILEEDDLIVVKLSDDYYYDIEYLTAGIASFELPASTADVSGESLQRVESVQADEEKVQISGFQILPDVDAREVTTRVLLRNCRTGELYEVNTAREQNIRAAKQFPTGDICYEACGFSALCPLSFFEEYPNEVFEVLLCGSLNGESWISATGTTISKKIIDKMPRTILDKEYANHEFE